MVNAKVSVLMGHAVEGLELCVCCFGHGIVCAGERDFNIQAFFYVPGEVPRGQKRKLEDGDD